MPWPFVVRCRRLFAIGLMALPTTDITNYGNPPGG